MIGADRILQAVRDTIARELDMSPFELGYKTSLRNEHGLDSVAAVNIIFALEESLGVEIDLHDFAEADSLCDIHHILKDRDS